MTCRCPGVADGTHLGQRWQVLRRRTLRDKLVHRLHPAFGLHGRRGFEGFEDARRCCSRSISCCASTERRALANSCSARRISVAARTSARLTAMAVSASNSSRSAAGGSTARRTRRTVREAPSHPGWSSGARSSPTRGPRDHPRHARWRPVAPARSPAGDRRSGRPAGVPGGHARLGWCRAHTASRPGNRSPSDSPGPGTR